MRWNRRYAPRRRARRSGGRAARHAAIWFGGFVGAALLAPVAEDARSRLRQMDGDCAVARVIDGDTVMLACGGAPARRARITGYDAPELTSPACPAEAAAAREARRHLQALIGPARVEVAMLGTDRYGRDLVDMRVDGRRVATEMVQAGHGRRYLGGLRRGWCG